MRQEKKYFNNDLGVTYSPNQSVFKVWSPSAKNVCLKLYTTGSKDEQSLYSLTEMNQIEGVWTTTIFENIEELFYTYVIEHQNGEQVETNDIYAKAVGVNGDRAAIIDMKKTNPHGWEQDFPVSQKTLTDAYIWEVHIADFSSDVASGITEKNRGKYLAFTEKQTTLYKKGIHPTCVNYLKNLGVNYVHLLPCFDTDNDELGEEYNWGYNPKNYNVPEGRYSSNPVNPYARIREFKQMVQSLHEAGIGIILDVVYNHTSITENSWFNLTYPGYYYRQNEQGEFADGSACGNEVASERWMVRKFIADSVVYWAKEYHLDGFRFDLMGLHDVETMNVIRKQLNEAGLQHVVLYGEPWDAGSNEIKLPDLPANKENVKQLNDRIAVFNDDLRDAVKGYVFEEKEGGFVQGTVGKKNQGKHPYLNTADLKAGLLGNTRSDLAEKTLYAPKPWYRTPDQVINYISAHDNLTLWDKLVLSTKDVTGTASFNEDPQIIRMNQLAATLLFTSQGGIFTQAGEEFGRTKYGNENSYDSSLALNQLSWQQIEDFEDLVAYYKGLWEIRKSYPPLRDSTCQTANSIQFSQLDSPNVVAYTIPNTLSEVGWNQLAVIVNSGEKVEKVTLESSLSLPKKWRCLADNESASAKAKYEVETEGLLISPRSSLILAH